MSDLRLAVRSLFRQSALSGMIIGMLALGIAGTTAIFSIFNGLFLRPLPVEEPERLVDIDEEAPKWNLEYVSVAAPDYYAWRADNKTFDSMAAYDELSVNMTGEGQVERIDGVLVTHDMLKVLRLKPVLGRGFLAEEDKPGGPKVVMLTHGLWQRMFGGRRDVLGKVLRFNGESYSVIGVLPPEAVIPGRAQIWGLLQVDAQNNNGWWLNAIGRLKPGATVQQARADLLRVHKARIDTRKVNEITSPKMQPLRERVFGNNVRTAVLVVLGSVGVVLLIACVNIAGLMLARGTARGREMGIRAALGASRLRIVRQLLAESLALAVVGGVLGVVLGALATKALVALMPENQLPNWVRFDTDWRFLAFSATVTSVAALLFGLWPAISASRVDLRNALNEMTLRSSASRGSRWSLNGLVMSEVALAVLLLVASGLLVRAFYKLQLVNPGFRAENVLTYRVAPPTATYKPDRLVTFYQALIERTRAIPGVRMVGACSAPPLGGHWGMFYEIENAGDQPLTKEEQDPVVLTRIATPGYFEAMGMRLAAGRWFNDRDGIKDGPRSVIVNETFARRYWRGVDPIGRKMRHRGSKDPWVQVVGVAGDVKHYGLEQAVRPGVYFPMAMIPRDLMMVIRSTVEPTSLTAAAREVLKGLDPELPMFQVRTMDDRLAESMWLRRTYSWLLGVFSIVALLLAAGGIYGVISYSVGRRTHEIGIRMALGAKQSQVIRQVLRQGLALAAAGLLVGLIGAALAARRLGDMLFGVDPRDPVIYGSVAAALIAVAVLANAAPARRAASVDPMSALRVD
jgi:putative ABC transport system permease protein